MDGRVERVEVERECGSDGWCGCIGVWGCLLSDVVIAGFMVLAVFRLLFLHCFFLRFSWLKL